MNRRITGLLAALCLISACKDEPVGKMEPIAPTPDMPANLLKAEAPKKPAPAPEPPPDPSKVTLRWKLEAPLAFRLTTTASGDTSSVFVLKKSGSGDYAFRIVPEGAGGEADQGTMSERGFVLDGLAGPLRNTAALVLELPRDPVGQDATWALGTDLVDLSAFPNFIEQKAERKNQVKLAALTPAENGEQVATLEYDLSESISGQLRGPAPAAAPAPKPEPKGGKDEAPKAPQSASAEVRVTGRGEFLVKAGRWRSWEGTLTTHVEGLTLPGMTNGESKLRLTPLDPVPPELLQPQAKK